MELNHLHTQGIVTDWRQEGQCRYCGAAMRKEDTRWICDQCANTEVVAQQYQTRDAFGTYGTVSWEPIMFPGTAIVSPRWRR
jgi:hypothetical protein